MGETIAEKNQAESPNSSHPGPEPGKAATVKHGGFLHGQLTRTKGLVPLDGKGWITGGLFPKPVAIQGRKALGVACRKPVQKSAVTVRW